MPELTPDAWCAVYGLEIADPDGWRGKEAPSWDTPLALAAFWSRFAQCTVRQVSADTYARIQADRAAEAASR